MRCTITKTYQVKDFPIPTATQPYGGEHPHEASTNIPLGAEGAMRRPTCIKNQAQERNS